ncbi:MAG: pyridoxal-dependent decarboxylase [Acidimicrobiia bacterium]|nr:pyridoxal-dependent decarboxylase [Acidimicrobiia bacterium]
MTPDEFRAAGHALVDWVADLRAGLEDRPVKAPAPPGAVAALMPAAPPDAPESFEALLAELDRVVVPGMTHLQHPRNFAWFPANHSLASVLGDLASGGLGGLGISWEACPALTEVEQVVCDWMRRLVGLSDAWSGTIADTASTSCLSALACARERATRYAMARGGLAASGAPLRIYTTEHAHSSVRKAAMLAGFGAEHLVTVDVDERYAMRPDALAGAIEADRAAGLVPCAVVASVGSTGVTALDPVAAVVEVAQRDGVWVHVDAALAGSAMLLPECRWMWAGVEGADSLVWNPHKWLGTALDCSLYYVRDVTHLVRVMSTNPSYLRSEVDGAVVQYRDWGVPLGRRFRALKLWFQLHLDGVEPIRERLRRDLDNARWLAGEVDAAEHWKVLAPVPLQTVCVRHEPPSLAGGAAALDAHTLRWARALNDSGFAFVTPAQLDGAWMVRVSIGVESTERRHVAELWAEMRRLAEVADA